MKILGIVCSARKGGNTEILVKEALASAQGASCCKSLLHADRAVRFRYRRGDFCVRAVRHGNQAQLASSHLARAVPPQHSAR